MGLLDGVMGMLQSSGLEGEAISAIAGKVGIDPAMAQSVAGSLMSNLAAGQSPQDAAQAAADEHGVDPSAVSQLGDAMAAHTGAEGGLAGLAGSLLGGAGGGEGGALGGLLNAAGGASGVAGMLGGLLGKKD